MKAKADSKSTEIGPPQAPKLLELVELLKIAQNV
jgi:hypothetical protein